MTMSMKSLLTAVAVTLALSAAPAVLAANKVPSCKQEAKAAGIKSKAEYKKFVKECNERHAKIRKEHQQQMQNKAAEPAAPGAPAADK